jgi:hypothetical protein
MRHGRLQPAYRLGRRWNLARLQTLRPGRFAAHRVRQHRRGGALRSEGAAAGPDCDEGYASDSAIRFRIGIDIGDAIADGTDLHGDGVIIAARLQAECPSGAVCVSRGVRDYVHDRLDLAFEMLGPLDLKISLGRSKHFCCSLCGRRQIRLGSDVACRPYSEKPAAP